MAQKNKDIVFRRINGHIVPIRLTKKGKDMAIGAGQVVAGGAVAATAAHIAADTVVIAATKRLAAKQAFRQANQMLMHSGLTKPQVINLFAQKQGAAIIRRSAMRIRAFRNPILGTGAALSAGLVMAGFDKLFDKKDYKETIASDAGKATTLATYALYYKNLGMNPVTGISHAIARRAGNLVNMAKIPIKTGWGVLKF